MQSPPPVAGASLPFRLWTPEERQASLRTALQHWRDGEDVWVYGLSLIHI